MAKLAIKILLVQSIDLTVTLECQRDAGVFR